MRRYRYPYMTKKLGDFQMEVSEGDFTDSEIIVMLGENGTGKTTFIRMMAGLLKPDSGGERVFITIIAVCYCFNGKFFCCVEEVPRMNVSYKPQKISPKFQGTVRQLFHSKIQDTYMHPQFITDVIKPLQMEHIMDQEVLNLSGGELQRVALTLCLGQVSHLLSPSIYCINLLSVHSLLMCT